MSRYIQEAVKPKEEITEVKNLERCLKQVSTL